MHGNALFNKAREGCVTSSECQWFRSVDMSISESRDVLEAEDSHKLVVRRTLFTFFCYFVVLGALFSSAGVRV